MPNYEYKCTNQTCDHELTVTCKMSQYSPIQICEVCGSDMTRKVENMVSEYISCQGFYGKSSK